METIKRTTRRNPIFTWTCNLMLVPCAFSGWTCSCVEETLEIDFKDADLVFAGTVLHRCEPEGNGEVLTTDLIEVEFKLDKSWKGETGDNMTVSTEQTSASCGYPFKFGDRYVVFASAIKTQSEENGETREYWYSGLCASNEKLDYSSEVEALLEEL
ncbi:MAG: hypothetical protein F4X44_08195 [Gammaproteobacteria bacterium]|nr:hypothetical protein [Gammaproteobacteria bacterium]MYD80577.1 hypothetical protein [Gammaproteobacteria bacterium]